MSSVCAICGKERGHSIFTRFDYECRCLDEMRLQMAKLGSVEQVLGKVKKWQGEKVVEISRGVFYGKRAP